GVVAVVDQDQTLTVREDPRNVGQLAPPLFSAIAERVGDDSDRVSGHLLRYHDPNVPADDDPAGLARRLLPSNGTAPRIQPSNLAIEVHVAHEPARGRRQAAAVPVARNVLR